jgi:hypothetical protein
VFLQFPPIRLPKSVELICRLNYPSPFQLEELHPNGIAVAMHWLAVSHSSRGTKLSCARSKNQLRTFIPVPGADYTRTLPTDVFRKCVFHAGNMPITLENNGDLHLDAILTAVEGIIIPEKHWSSPQRHAAMRVMEFIVLPRRFMR